jgi:hypothetical protein
VVLEEGVLLLLLGTIQFNLMLRFRRAALVSLGENGYLERTKVILDTVKYILGM